MKQTVRGTTLPTDYKSCILTTSTSVVGEPWVALRSQQKAFTHKLVLHTGLVSIFRQFHQVALLTKTIMWHCSPKPSYGIAYQNHHVALLTKTTTKTIMWHCSPKPSCGIAHKKTIMWHCSPKPSSGNAHRNMCLHRLDPMASALSLSTRKVTRKRPPTYQK